MYEYARLGMQQIKQAAGLVTDYFSQVNEAFVGKYFKNRKGMLARATSQASWNQIVVTLNNTHQQNIVHCNPSNNQLVLASRPWCR